jgi:hypothetical protein
MLSKKNFGAIVTAALLLLPLGAALDSADARTRRGNATVTTERGTVQRQTTTTRTRGSRSRDTVTTGPNGAQRSVSTDVDRTAPGEFSMSREVTGRNGETRTQTGDFTRTSTETGHSLTGDINTTHNGQIDYQRDVSHENGARSVNSSATFEDGSAITRASTGSCAMGSCSSTGVVTGRDGGQASWDQTRTRTENGATLDRDITFADGTTRSVEAERTGNGDGTGEITRTVTTRDGETRTQTGEYEITPTP